jgi:hypothetical protein
LPGLGWPRRRQYLGPSVKKYLQPEGLPEGNSWCAAFVRLCFLQAAGGDKKTMPFKYSAGAKNIFNQLKHKGLVYDANVVEPCPGDIVSWWRVDKTSGFSHIGIVHHFNDGFLYTIEVIRRQTSPGFHILKHEWINYLGMPGLTEQYE